MSGGQSTSGQEHCADSHVDETMFKDSELSTSIRHPAGIL